MPRGLAIFVRTRTAHPAASFPREPACFASPRFIPLSQGWALPAEGSRPLASPALLFSSCPDQSVCLFPDPKNLMGYCVTSRDRWPSYPTHPSSACACPPQGLFMLGRVFCYVFPPHTHPGLPAGSMEPWKPHGSHRALAKHAVFVLCSLGLSKFAVVPLNDEGLQRHSLEGWRRGGGHGLGWLCKVITQGPRAQRDARLTPQTCPICHGPVRNLPEFPLLSKGRPPGSAERAQGIN